MEMEGELLFGPFTLSLDRRELRQDGRVLPLGVRALELLALLAGRAGEVVGRDEIAAHLAPGAGVEQGRLRAHVAALRRALRDGEDGNRYIVNVLGRGYVFVASVRRAGRAALPPLSNLPDSAGPLLGRAGAVASLVRLVDERRLVSVVGAGGLGKSALALAVAWRAAPRFGGRVAYLDLAPLCDGARLADAVATAVGLAAGNSLPDLCAALAGRRLLLVLDNCGHLADPVALLAETLLGAAPQVHLLATSREALNLRAEWVHRLAPLALPAALELFALHLGARLAPAARAQAAQQCRQLDGNPLLIRLAAARSRTAGLGALAGGEALADQGAQEGGRHRSADALLDWSWRLLAPCERAVLRRLAVFCRSFTLDAAARVCACPEIDSAAVSCCVLALGARSLVEVEAGRHGVRYRLTNTTRHYARRRLAQDGELPILASRHASAMLGLFRAAGPMDPGLEDSVDDAGAAIDWALADGGEPQPGIELAALCTGAMIACGRIDDHLRRLELARAALARLPDPPPGLEPPLLAALVTLLALSHAAPERARDPVARLAALAHAGAPAALQAMHLWQLAQGDYPAAWRLGEGLMRLALGPGNPEALFLAWRFQAGTLHFLGRHDEAARTAAAIAVAGTDSRDAWLAPCALAVQARSAWIGGRPDTALALADAALAAAEGRHPFVLCQAICTAALPVALWRGEPVRVQALYTRLAGATGHGAAAYWRPWLHALRSALHERADGAWPAPLCDLLATAAPRLASGPCLARVLRGAVGWCAPEVLRAHGENMLRAGAPVDEVERLWLAARALARRQRAPGWELRIATSLAVLWRGTAREGEGAQALEALCARFDEGAGTADLVLARARPGAFRMPGTRRQPAIMLP